MHRIVKAHLDSFVKSFGLEADDEATRFEKFSMYCVLSSRYTTSFDLDDVTTGTGDDSVDGIAIVVDEAVNTSVEETRYLVLRGGTMMST
jgi:hypothetical protein